MARIKKNSLLHGLSGKIGDFIIKQYRYGTVISTRPDMTNVRRTSEQKKTNGRFKEAVTYAKHVASDAELRKQYEKKATKKGRSVYHLALADYMKDKKKTLQEIGVAVPALKRVTRNVKGGKRIS